MPEPLDPTRTDGDFGEFIWVVPGEYVARYGCAREHLDVALAFLRESTQRFSAENAIRPFLAAFPDETLAFVRACSGDANYHVRRLASEGTRPFLPWAPLLAAMIGAGFLGTMLGRRVLDRLPHEVFARIFKIVLTLLALRLLYAAAS